MAKSLKYSDPKVLAAISGLMFRARHVVEGTITGLHKSPFHGHNVEFAEYREYAPGDDLRRLDWRALGRTDRFFIKQYEEESNLQATIVMDASASMRYGEGAMTKFDYAATLAAALATLLIEQQDPVGLALFDNQQRRALPPVATQSQLALIIGHLEEAKPDRETELGTVLQSLGDQLKRRGLIVIISDLLTDLPTFFDGLDRLIHRGNEVLIMHILDGDELDLPFQDFVLFRDIEGTEQFFAEPWSFRKAYCAAMQEFVNEIKDGCGRRGIDTLLLRTDQELADGLSHYLHARERLQHIHRKGRV